MVQVWSFVTLTPNPENFRDDRPESRRVRPVGLLNPGLANLHTILKALVVLQTPWKADRPFYR